jgi:hypothetical protein
MAPQAQLAMPDVIGQLTAVLSEAFDGPPGNSSYFTDSRRNTGLFGTLGPLSAEQASTPFAGSTIAAHVHHLVFSLEASSAWIHGDRSSRDWGSSWRVSRVDEAGWTKLREDLRRGYAELRSAVDEHATDGVDAAGGAIAVVAHVAYHLGAIRQKTAALKERSA